MEPSKGRIGIDARLWSHPGIGRYLRELFFAMLSVRKGESFRLLMPEALSLDASLRHSGAILDMAASSAYTLGEQWELHSFSRRVPLLHVPHFNIPVFHQGRLVATVHDLIYLKGSRHSGSSLGKAYAEFMFRTLEKKADAVMTVSEYTRQELLHHFPKLKGRVTVTHEAASSFFRPAREDETPELIRKKFKLSGHFVLFVGSLKRHKNVPLLIDAVSQMRRQKGMEHELVLVGRADPKAKEILHMIEENKDFVRSIGNCNDEQLLALYHAADVLVLPSEWEGFGLPILEAMSCGTPVIASRRCSLPEIGGEAALYFEPGRVDALSELLYNVLHNKELQQKMRGMGIAQAAKFSWRRTADETLAVYERVLG